MNWRRLITISLLFIFSCSKDDVRWDLKKLPSVSNIVIVHNDLDSLEVSAELLDNGFDNELEFGFCYSFTEDPNISDNPTPVVFLDNQFSYDFVWNQLNSPYVRIKAYARNSVGISYSETQVVTNPATNYFPPEVWTSETTTLQVHMTMAQVGGTVANNGGLPILEYGVCYSTYPNPHLDSSSTLSTSLTIDYLGDFLFLINGLNNNTTYHYRAFAKTAAGTSYGDNKSFTTLQDYNIGDIGPTGGLVFYRSEPTTEDWHFLEAHHQDIPPRKWSDAIISSNVVDTYLGIGDQNTELIVNLHNSVGTAAKDCYDYNWIYYDWFLPSRDELILMQQNLHANGVGNFINGHYWTSSEDENFSENAWIVNFSSGQSFTSNKLIINYIRPIRKF